jgi:hypothetical protein
MNSKKSEILNEAIIEVINNQMDTNDPPETKQTYDRLMKKIGNHDEVIRYIGCVVCSEIFDVLKRQEDFNRQRYIDLLNKLPDISWLDK